MCCNGLLCLGATKDQRVHLSELIVTICLSTIKGDAIVPILLHDHVLHPYSSPGALHYLAGLLSRQAAVVG